MKIMLRLLSSSCCVPILKNERVIKEASKESDSDSGDR